MNIFDIGVNHLPQTITVPTQKVLWKIEATNNGTFNLNSGVTLQLTWSTPVIYHRTSDHTDNQGLTFGNGTAANTFFNIANGLWTIGSLAVNQTKTLIIETSLAPGTNLNTALPLQLTKTISVSGFTDSQTGNNVSIDILQGPSLEIDCAPAAAAVSGQGCVCSVAKNDTPCNYGVTEWRIIPGSLVNTVLGELNFNTATGEYTKYQTDPTLDATFQYGIYCLKDGVEVAGPFIATETIPAQFNINSFNHTVLKRTWLSLTNEEKAAVQALNVGITHADFCYVVTKNADGIITSAYPEICDPEKDTRTFYVCTNIPCDNDPNCDCESNLPTDINLPETYTTPQIGDTIIIRHPNAQSVWIFNGSNFIRTSCGCMPLAKIIAGMAFTGTNTKTLKIEFTDGTFITASFADLQGGLGGGEANDGVNIGTGREIFKGKDGVNLEFRTVVGGTNTTIYETDDEVVINSNLSIQHAPCSIASGAGTVGSPLVVNPPVPDYYYLTSVLSPSTSSVISLAAIFPTPCPGGCTASYNVEFNPAVYASVVINTGAGNVTLTTVVNPVSGNHPVIINRNCG